MKKAVLIFFFLLIFFLTLRYLIADTGLYFAVDYLKNKINIDNTSNQVSIQNGTLDSPDMIFTLDSGVASLINSGELTTEEAFLRGLLQFDGDVAKLIDIFSKINQ